ncbi:hypothetical protein ACP179_01775 (plasmid) [Xenorhabdus stockiae]|uniref:hypothetical protein n=1 Tax=Xenorhabdus stockiae TaxID=351614 RepID=UPI003CEB8D92
MSKIEKQQQMVFYVPGELWPVAVAILVNEKYVTSGGQSLDQVKQRYPGCELMSYENAYRAINDAAKRPVERVSAAKYIDQLEVLPPLDRQGDYGSESFKIREMYTGNITDIYVKIGTEHFTLRDHVSLSHSEIRQRVRAFIETEIESIAA